MSDNVVNYNHKRRFTLFEFAVLEGEDMSAVLAEMLKFVQIVRQINTPDIGELSKMTKTIKGLSDSIELHAQAISKAQEQTNAKSTEEKTFEALRQLSEELKLVHIAIEGIVAQKNEKREIPLVVSQQILDDTQKSKDKKTNEEGGEFGFWAMVGISVIASIVTGGVTAVLVKMFLTSV